MKLRFVNTMDDVLAYALERPLPEVPDEASPGITALLPNTEPAPAHQ
jgi:hypothetical protein